ncbi:MAG: prolyl oligopeptidase family serine peptidase [Bryobacteraceae bacterium]|nr:prolyl oligopeptidase family serine peptidase [Bryobacteraceae bacterium]
MKSACLIAGACVVLTLAAQPRFSLTIDNIMRGPGLYGYEPRNVRWSGDGKRVYFQWKRYNDSLLEELGTYVVGRDGAGLRRLSDEEMPLAPPAQGMVLSRDEKWGVYTSGGDLYLYEVDADKARRLTKTGEAEGAAHFGRDARRVAFTRANNLYVLSLEDGMIEQLTDIRPPGSRVEGEEKKAPENQEYLKKDERELLEAVRERAKKREEDEAKRKRANARKPFVLQQRQTVAALQLTPDEKHVIVRVTEAGTDAKRTIVPNFVTESAFTEPIDTRVKVGDPPGRTRLAVVTVASGEWKWVEPEPKDRTMTPLNVVWSRDAARAVFFARAADNKDRWLFALDVAGAKTRQLFHEHDEAWIQGPRLFSLGWLADDRTLWFQSERSGYSHVYALPYDGGEARALTQGKWEVQAARLSRDRSKFYLTTNEAHPGEQHFYVMPADGGDRVKVTGLPGQHEAEVSPDGGMLANVHSTANRPPELFVMENRAGAQMTQVTKSPAPEFSTYPWTAPPVVTFKARDGAEVYARLYKPEGYRKGGPAVVFVHGAGYLQNAHKGWSSYAREYLFHHLLMERGYLVLDMDYRGSAGHGRDWRAGIYRHMGGKDLEDHVDGVKWLVKEHGVDPKRVGLYGGSYGGFITLMAMFTQPDVFAAGAALRPVTDWAHYNHPYTSNILNLPQKDAEAYKKSSPIYFAEGLKGALLIAHGMVDVNVHYQDSVRLVQRLIELRKENWEFASYPVEDHGFVQPASWADEYKRILKLFEANLKAAPEAGRRR